MHVSRRTLGSELNKSIALWTSIKAKVNHGLLAFLKTDIPNHKVLNSAHVEAKMLLDANSQMQYYNTV